MMRWIRRTILMGVLVCGGCENQPVVIVDSVMNNAQRDELLAAQAKLDETMKQHSPFVFVELAPPATDAELDQLRTALGEAKRPYLELWFKWHNGYKNRPMELLPLGMMHSIKRSLSDRDLIQTISFVEYHRRRDIKILDDGCGDGYFLDLSKSPPRVYYDMLESPGIPTDYGTMIQFLQFIERVHAAGITSITENGMVDFDNNVFYKLQDEHLAAVARSR